MPSLSARTAVGLLRVLQAKRIWTDPTSAERRLLKLAKRPERYAPPRRLRANVSVEADRWRGWPLYTVRPSTRAPIGTMIYTHGGGWVHEISPLHWRLIAQVADEASVTVVVPIYPLVPFGTAGEVVSAIADLIDEIRASEERIVIAGDSAGGQIALSTALMLRDRQRPPLDLTLLIAPALDSSLTNPEIAEIELVDPWLGVEGTRVFIEAWRGELPIEDPRVSPLEGDMTGLGPVSLYCGTLDIVSPDSRLLVRKLEDAGVPVRYHEGTDLIHAYPLLPIREGAQARRTIGGEVRQAVRRPT